MLSIRLGVGEGRGGGDEYRKAAEQRHEESAHEVLRDATGK